MKQTLALPLAAALALGGCAHSEDRWQRALAERQELHRLSQEEAAKIKRLEAGLAQRGLQYPAADAALMASTADARSYTDDDFHRSGSSALPWVFVGVGVAAIAGSVGTWSAANSKESELNERCSEPNATNTRLCDSSLKSVRTSGENLLLATYILGIAGGASAALGVTLVAVDAGSSSTRLDASCSGAGCTLVARGEF